MKSSKKVIFICFIITAVLFSNVAIAQERVPLLSYNSLLSLWSPIASPISLSGLPTPLPFGAFPLLPPISLITRSAQIPLLATTVLGGGGAAAPTLIATSWSGSWTSFLNTNQFGPMTLTLTEDLAAGTFTGAALLSLNSLIPVSVSVSGAYTGVGLNISVYGIYSALTPVNIGGGPLATIVLVPVDYLLTLDFSIVAGAEIIGSYAIDSLQRTDFGSIYLTIL